MGSLSIEPFYYRVLAEKEIRLPRIISITRWLSLTHKLSAKDLKVENEVLIRPGKKEDLDFMANSEDVNAPENGTLLQDIRWWREYGFRCLYVGYLEDERQPCGLEYWIEDTDNHRIKNMEYGGLYRPLDTFTVQADGAYIRKDLRGKDIFPKLLAKGHKLFYQKGKKLFRAHIACNKTRIPAFKMARKSGYVPDYWISRVTVNLRFFRSSAFVHHKIKQSDLNKFPISLF